MTQQSIKRQSTPHIYIALTGKMRSGKDTVAEQLSKQFKKEAFHVNQIAFGYALKAKAKELYPEEFVEGKKPRELYQWFGQTLRERNEDVWVNQVAQFINKKNKDTQQWGYDPQVYIITDLRQPNEYQFCKDNNFIIIKVECDDVTRINRLNALGDNYTPTDLHHDTETHIDSFNVTTTIDTSELSKDELNTYVEEIKDKAIEKFITIKGEI
ncbi:AAA family ATPase [Mammaliicoccus sciuri]|uniref:AAA family ATPase n=1 Tax=Mammaliicoccus sciuri TaxID=1296 RepID=UPI002B25E8E6|nr:AAA family ATPase [Mammaliicoccus sciuri]WQK75310.1 AAA family ATPase [Mammaliicoccus sciuri]